MLALLSYLRYHFISLRRCCTVQSVHNAQLQQLGDSIERSSITLCACMQLGVPGPSNSRSQKATRSVTKQLRIMALTVLALSSRNSPAGATAGSISAPLSRATHGTITSRLGGKLGAAAHRSNIDRMLVAKCTKLSSSIACRSWACRLQ